MTEMTLDYLKHQENQRHNEVSEDQGQQTIDENKRHNRVYEYETNRHNVVTENETARHNKEGESVQWFNAHEGAFHNRQTEKQAKNELAEKARNNQVLEGIKQGELDEKKRTDVVQETLKQEANENTLKSAAIKAGKGVGAASYAVAGGIRQLMEARDKAEHDVYGWAPTQDVKVKARRDYMTDWRHFVK